MARIVVMPYGPHLAHVSRPLLIAVVLRNMGHEVIFAGDGASLRLARESGFPVVFAKEIPEEHMLSVSRKGRANWWDGYLQEMVEEDCRVFSELHPNLVLGDFRLSLSTSCEHARIPMAMIMNAAWTNYYTVRCKAPEHLAATRILGKPISNFLFPLVKRAILKTDARTFRKLRRSLGLDPRRNMWDMWRGNLNLLVDTPAYAPTRDLPPDFRYIGPLVWEPDVAAPPWLETLDPKRPTIYFTMGSTGFPRFFEQAVEIFGDSEYQCIMTTAGMARFDSLPSNFYCCDFASGTKIREKSTVVVCHGGNGTIYQAMSRSVPVIGIPTMHDQEWNLDRIVDLGMGIHLSELRFKPEHLREAVARVVGDPQFKRAAERQRAEVERYDAPRLGAELIDRFLKG